MVYLSPRGADEASPQSSHLESSEKVSNMAALISNYHSPPPPLESPDDEIQRGRKRRRSSGNSPPVQAPSGGSTTLRGRGRYRSLSHSQTTSHDSPWPSEEKPRSRSPRVRESPDHKPRKKQNLRVPPIKKRRSPSPSRSRSNLQDKGTPRPRRKRTRSRGRSHEVERRHSKEVGAVVKD
jgi:hypothetical protein